ncbi:MAG TPA: tetratricopeptide repeat protein [Candidatus Acidoferrales bacterium]|jgi:tetratricopeptide (TPR) repeat protein|nr:tetratricopeptide repeat protein [Candidatus Acidoferrales bacterium]
MGYSKIKHVEAAQKHLAQGKIDQSIAEYQQILRHEPTDQVTLMTIGDLYVRKGETFKAIEFFERLAQQFIRDGFLTKAIAIYKKIAKLAPEEMKPLERLAELYIQQGVLSEARPLLLQLAESHIKAGRREPASALLRKLLEAEPDNLRVQMRLAEVQLAMGQKADAAQTFLVCAERHLALRDYDEAVRLISRAVELAPGNAAARFLKARVLAAAGKLDEAAKLLESLPGLDSGDDAADLLMDLFLQGGQPARAADLALRVMANDPKKYALARKAAMSMLEKGQADAALDLVNRFRHPMAESGETEALAKMLQAAAAKLPGRLEPLEWIVELYTHANDAFHLPEALSHLAQAAAAGGNLDRAREIYEQLLERSPEDQTLRQNLEAVRSRLGLQPVEHSEAIPPMAEEPPAPEKPKEPPLDEETQNYVTVALTDVDLFSSYGLSQKAIDLLEAVLERAPRYTPALEKLLDLSLGAGQSKRTSEIAEKLAQIYTERGDAANADRFTELHRRFMRAAALEPEAPPSAAPAPAPPAEFQIPTPDAEISLAAPNENEIVEEMASANPAESSVHEVDLSEEWAAISEQMEKPGGKLETPAKDSRDDEPVLIESNSAPFVIEDAPEPESRTTPPQPLRPPQHVEPEPVEYELELVEEENSTAGPASVSPIRPPAKREAENEGALGDLAAELDTAFDGASFNAPPAPANGSARTSGPQFAPPAERASLPSDPGGPLSEIFDEFRKELDELQMDEDPETHYNLGVAYREMGLLEEAISEFQKVMQAHDRGRDFRYAMQCCTLLALAFIDKGQPEIASFWYERALKTPGLDQDAVLALRYDLGVAQELAGQSDAALKSYQQVYAMNIDYRDISERIGSLRHR